MSEFWTPTEGDRVRGTLVELDVYDGKHGRCPLLSIDTDDGLVKVRASQTVLKEELAKRSPQVGELVDITYLGMVGQDADGEGGYHSYAVVGGELAFSWAEFGGRDRTPSATVPSGPEGPATPSTPAPEVDEPGRPGLISGDQLAQIEEIMGRFKPGIVADLRTQMARSHGVDWKDQISADLADRTIARLQQLAADPTNLQPPREPEPAAPAPQDVPF